MACQYHRGGRGRPAAGRRLNAWLGRLCITGLLLVAAWPAARGQNPWLGWWPMWLVGMPATAMWALNGFSLPLARMREAALPVLAARRPVQARRWRR